MHRNPTPRQSVGKKRPPLPPKQTLRPTAKPQPRMLLKQHRGGR